MKNSFTNFQHFFKEVRINLSRIIAICILVTQLAWAQSTTVSLTPTADNSIFEDVNGALSNGVGTGLFAGPTQSGAIRRAFILFDLSEIPAGSTIESVTLTLNKTKVRGGAGEQPIFVHKALASWGEGTSNSSGSQGGGGGANSTANDATWLHRFFPDTLWGTPGGDFAETASATATTNASNTETVAFSSEELVADAQSWIDDPASNFGWTVLGNEGTDGSARRFASRENAGQEPTLEITFSGGTTADTATALLQVIHNAGDPAAAAVDVYINGDLALDDFAYRTATPFIELPAGVELSIAVAPGTSASVDDALATFPVTLADSSTNIAVANGVLDPSQFVTDVNAEIGFTLSIFPTARTAAEAAGNVDVLLFHGTTDAPRIDAIVPGVITLIEDLGFREFSDYQSLPGALLPGAIPINITVAGDSESIIAEFSVDLTSFVDSAITVLASGFASPADNQNGAPFSLIVAQAGGTVTEISPATSIADRFEEIPGLNVFPNPATQHVNIIGEALNNSQVEITLFDLQGKTMLVTEANPVGGAIDTNINISSLNPSVYTLKIQQDDKLSVRLLSVQ